MPGTYCYVPQCINMGNGHVINDHIQAINNYASRAIDTFCVTSSPRHELKSKFDHFFLSDTLAVSINQSIRFIADKLHVGSSFTFSFLRAPVIVFTNV